MFVVAFSSCTKYQFIDTGIANGKHDCSMWEYLSRDDFNWKYTRQVIERAEMVDLFKKRDNKITFLGFTSMSVENYLIGRQYESVAELDVEFCKDLVKRHIINTPIMSNDVPKGNRIKTGMWDDYGEIMIEKDGKIYKSMSGEVFMFTYQQDYDGVPEKGAIRLYFAGRKTQSMRTCNIASSNIETLTGVVHSLEYGFKIGDL